MLDNKEIFQIINEQDRKFDYAFATLSFAVLGLSIQFSPGYGKVLAPLLVVAWIFFLVSCLMAGYRIIYKQEALKINYNININKDFKNKMSPVLAAPLYDKAIDKEKIKLNVDEADRRIKDGESKFNKLNEQLSPMYWLQIGMFLLGLASNLVFVSANYLFKAGFLEKLFQIS